MKEYSEDKSTEIFTESGLRFLGIGVIGRLSEAIRLEADSGTTSRIALRNKVLSLVLFCAAVFFLHHRQNHSFATLQLVAITVKTVSNDPSISRHPRRPYSRLQHLSQLGGRYGLAHHLRRIHQECSWRLHCLGCLRA